MSYEFEIGVNPRYSRSVNIERDAEDLEVLEAFVLTDRALEVVDRVSGALKARNRPKSWALIGPYGSGKSMISLYLSELLGADSAEHFRAAKKKLAERDKGLASKIDSIRGKSGFLCVSVSGAPEPMRYRLVRSLYSAALAFWGRKRGRNPAIIGELEKLAKSKNVPLSDVMASVEQLREALKIAGKRGLLIQVDELGKFLEYEAKQAALEDLFLLQMLAEESAKDAPIPLVINVMLHQTFETYGKSLSGRQRAEWQKIQGRFELVPYIEGVEQSLRVVSKVIDQRWSRSQKKIVQGDVRRIIDELSSDSVIAMSGSMSSQVELFSALFPLHPVTAIMLPGLCNKIAQNERTLFSFLSSSEPGGFASLIAKRASGSGGSPWILPHEIFEYFVQNSPTTSFDPLTAKRWSEVVTAEERFKASSQLSHQLMQSIGLLNIHGASKGLRASPEVLISLARASGYSSKEAKAALSDIESQSVVNFRKFSNEYRVWQGSDVDIDGLIDEEIGNLADFDAAEDLNALRIVQPLVARRHSLKTGALRYFDVRFVADPEAVNLSSGNRPEVVVFLHTIPTSVRRGAWTNRVAVKLGLSEQLITLSKERRALERVVESRTELRNDPVARREVENRLQTVSRKQAMEAQRPFEEPGGSDWYWGGRKKNLGAPADLQALLSDVMDSVYAEAPIINNELINRDKVSSSAAAGRRRLFEAVLTSPDMADLGIAKYPPEKAIYRSLFRASNFHGKVSGVFKFKQPQKANDVCNFLPTLEFIKEKLKVKDAPVAVEEVLSEISEPPFGVKKGAHSFFVVLFYLLNESEVAFYEEGRFVPELNFEIVERLIAHPELFSLQLFQISGFRESLYRTYSEIVSTGADSKPNLLKVARPLAKFAQNLSGYARQTKRVPQSAVKVREAILESRSPGDLLFKDLPRACGFSDLGKGTSEAEFKEYKKTLVSALRELNRAQEELEGFVTGLLSSALFKKESIPLEDLMKATQRFKGLQDYTIDRDGLVAFINRLVDEKESAQAWFVSVSTFLARKPPTSWRDEDIQVADARLADLSRRLRDLESLRLSSERFGDTSGDFSAVLIRMVDQKRGEMEDIVAIGEDEEPEIARAQERILAELSNLPTDSLRLGALVRTLQRLTKHVSDSEAREEVNCDDAK